MYTSGWPKNQKRCCHSKGEPPACGCRRSLITSPAGMAVMNQAQVAYGRRASDIPRVRRSSVVAIMLSDPSSCATQKIAIDTAHRV